MKKTAAILLATGFEEIETVTPLDVLRRLNVNVTLLSTTGDRLVTGAHGLVLQADALLEEDRETNRDIVILPGGGPGSWNLRDNPEVLSLVQKQYAKGGLVAAICAAPIALAKAGLLENKTITAYPDPSVEADLDGAVNTGNPIERDGLIITAKGPGASLEFSFLIADALGYAAALPALKKGMII